MQTLPPDIVKILNARLQDEYNAERFYVAASIWCDLNGFPLTSDAMVDEYHDERKHQHKLQKHASDWGVMLSLPSEIPTPTFTSWNDIIKQAYDMELALWTKYNADAYKVMEYPSCYKFLQKFIAIQDESVVYYADIIKMAGGISDKFQLLMLEKKIFK